jgi:hypothetical protein
MKLYDLGLFVILFSTFFYFVAAVDRATDGGAKELTKAELVKELSPITTANHKNYN